MKGLKNISTGKEFLMTLLECEQCQKNLKEFSDVQADDGRRAGRHSVRTDSVRQTPVFLVKASESPQALYRILCPMAASRMSRQDWH